MLLIEGAVEVSHDVVGLVEVAQEAFGSAAAAVHGAVGIGPEVLGERAGELLVVVPAHCSFQCEARHDCCCEALGHLELVGLVVTQILLGLEQEVGRSAAEVLVIELFAVLVLETDCGRH